MPRPSIRAMRQPVGDEVNLDQLADLTATVASLGRAQSLDAANAAAAKVQAREQLRRFLAPGRGYVSTTAQMFRN